MSNLVVLAFDNEGEADLVRAAMNDVQKHGRTFVDDAAVVIRDVNGDIHVKHETDTGVKTGVVGGGFLGLFVGFLFGGPLVSAVVWALGGGIIGSLTEQGIPKEFVKEVKESMKPGSSALFIIIRDSDPAVALAALRPYKGHVIQTTLSSDAEESLKRILEKRS